MTRFMLIMKECGPLAKPCCKKMSTILRSIFQKFRHKWFSFEKIFFENKRIIYTLKKSFIIQKKSFFSKAHWSSWPSIRHPPSKSWAPRRPSSAPWRPRRTRPSTAWSTTRSWSRRRASRSRARFVGRKKICLKKEEKHLQKCYRLCRKYTKAITKEKSKKSMKTNREKYLKNWNLAIF
jgi:hypothetical protein